MATGFGERKSLPNIKKTLLVKVIEMEDNVRGKKGLKEKLLNQHTEILGKLGIFHTSLTAVKHTQLFLVILRMLTQLRR